MVMMFLKVVCLELEWFMIHDVILQNLQQAPVKQ